MVNYLVLFSPEQLIRRGIPTTKQANVLVHELFGAPSGRIYGYTGDPKTAKKIKAVLMNKYGASGRLKKLSPEEVDDYCPQPFPLFLEELNNG